MRAKQYVSELEAGQKVHSAFVLKEMQEKSFTSKEGHYLYLTLADKSGELPGICWDPGSLGEQVNAGDVVELSGHVQRHREQGVEVIVDAASVRRRTDFDPAYFIPVTSRDIDGLISELRTLADGVQHRELRELLKTFFDDETFMKGFSRVPATLMYNHAYMGGLIEHIANVAAICERVAERNPELDRDLLIAGALLHKVGKTEEYVVDTSIRLTRDGGLMGPILLSYRLLQPYMEVDEELAAKLYHMVSVNSRQFKPKFLEAAALAHAESLDAHLGGFRHVYEQMPDEGTEWYYDRRRGFIYRG